MEYYQSEPFWYSSLDLNITYTGYLSADWGVFAAYGAILLFGFPGNLSIIILVLYDNSLRNIANLLIANIAVSDFLVMVLCVPSTMVLNVKHSYPGGLFSCRTMFSTQVVSACLSSLSLAALSYERYRVISSPLVNRVKSPRIAVTCTIVLVWTISIAVGIPIFAMTTDFHMEIGNFIIHCCQYVPHYTLWGKCLKTLIFLGTFALPFAPLVFFNYRIARCLFKSMRENKRIIVATSPGAEVPSRSRRKLTFIVCVMVLVFVASWLPFHVFIFAQEFGGDRFQDHPITHEINKLIHLLPYFSSAVNPWIMYTMSTGYRQKLLKMLRCRRGSPSHHRPRLLSPRINLSSKPRICTKIRRPPS